MSLVLITGGAGFVGSNIAHHLAGTGRWEVAICDRLGSASSGKWRNLASTPVADLVHPEDLFDWLGANGVDLAAMVHMGAISSTTEEDVDLIVSTNLTLSQRLWEWCAQAGKPLIYASSAATYGAGELGFDDRSDLEHLAALRPLNAYGWSKAMFDIYAERQAQAGRRPPQWAGLKLFNVYGPNEIHKGSMRSMVSQIWPAVAAGRQVRLFKSHRADYPDGGQLRDFVDVADVSAVVAWLLDNPHVSGLFNVGSGQPRSFRDLAEAVFHAAGQRPLIDYFDMPAQIAPNYQYFTQADLSRLRAAGYAQAATPLEAGVTRYVVDHLAVGRPHL